MIEARQKRLIVRGYLLIFIPIVLNWALSFLLNLVNIKNETITTIFFAVFLIVLGYVLIVLWVPNKIALVIMEPGTGLVVGTFGAPSREYKNLVSDKRLYGGLRIVGIPGIHSVLSGEIEEHYVIKGISLEERKKSIVDNVSMMERGYGGEASSLDTSDRQPLHVVYMLKGKVVSPKKFLFSVDKPIKLTNQIVIGVLRQKIREMTFDAIFTKGKTALAEEVWGEVKKEIKRIEEEYGLQIIDLVIVEVAPLDAEAVRAEFLAKQKGKAAVAAAQLAAEASIIEANAKKMVTETIAAGNANARAMEIGKATLQTFCGVTGLTENNVNFLMITSPEEFKRKYGETFKECAEAVLTAYKVDRKAFFQFQGAGQSGSGNLANTIAEGTLIAGMMKDVLGNYQTPRDMKPASSPTPETTKPKSQNTADSKKEKEEESKPSPEKGFKKEIITALEIMGVDPAEELDYYKANNDFTDEGLKALFRAGVNVDEEKELFNSS